MSVFVSYSHIDEDFVKRLTKLLDKHKIPYFLDSKDITWGSSISEEIRQASDNAEYLVVVISPASLQSSWVPYEIGLARGKNAKILPILTHPSLELPGYLADIKYLTSLNAVDQFLGTDFRRALRLGILLRPGHAMPLIKDVGPEEAERLGLTKNTYGINEYSLDMDTIPDDQLPFLEIVVTNNESREVEFVRATIEFTEEVRLNPEAHEGFSAIINQLNQPIVLRPSGVTRIDLPVNFNAMIEAFCTGKVSGVCVEDNQKFKCYAPDVELAKVASYFGKFFRHIDVDELRIRYSKD